MDQIYKNRDTYDIDSLLQAIDKCPHKVIYHNYDSQFSQFVMHTGYRFSAGRNCYKYNTKTALIYGCDIKFVASNIADEVNVHIYDIHTMLICGMTPNIICTNTNIILMEFVATSCRGIKILMAKILILIGADVNLQNKYNQTALMLAAADSGNRSSDDAVKLLVRAGAKLDMQDANGETALMLAVCHFGKIPVAFTIAKKFFTSVPESTIETIQFLIDSGANVNVQDSQGQTPLMIATMRYSPSATINSIDLLYTADIDTIRTREGKTGLDYITQYCGASAAKIVNNYYKQKMNIITTEYERSRYRLGFGDMATELIRIEYPTASLFDLFKASPN